MLTFRFFHGGKSNQRTPSSKNKRQRGNCQATIPCVPQHYKAGYEDEV